MNEPQKYPKGWDELRVRDVLAHYEGQTEEEQVADIPVDSQGSPYYALEKLGLAVDALAVGEGDVRSRLSAAYMEMVAVSTRDFPEPLRAEFEDIKYQLTKHPKRYDDDSAIHHTLSRMQNRTGSKIAQRIVELESRLDGLLKDEEGH